MKKLLLNIVVLVSILTGCVGEDFIEEALVFPPKFSISNGSVLGIDSLLVNDSIQYLTVYFNTAGEEADVAIQWESSKPEIASVNRSGKLIALKSGVTNITASANGLIAERLVVVQKFERIELSVSDNSLVIGEEEQITANYYNRNNELTVVNLSWLSSATAVVSVSSSGKVTAQGVGSANVSASFNGITGNVIAFNVVDVERIEISSTINRLLVGEQLTVAGKYYNQQGNQVSVPLSWMSSNSSVATIDNNGVLTAVSSGKTEITATNNGVNSNSLSIEVIDDTTTAVSISISASASSVTVGSSLNFSAEVRNINGKILPNEPVQWFSSDPAVLSVNGNGVASGIASGSSDVSATSGNAQSGNTNILVTNPVTTSRTGNFSGANGYSVSGSVTMNVQANNTLQLNFSNFSSSGSGNLFIHLSNSAGSVSGSIELERLNFRNGSFTVSVPAGVNINDYNYVVIWCRGVGQSFGAALLN